MPGLARRTALMLVLLLALPTPAWAHGQLGPGRATAGTTVSTVLVVPSEREGRTNTAIALALPPEFVPVSCGAPDGWTCTSTRQGFSWRRAAGAGPAERFDLRTLVSGRPGTYVFPLSQTYDDGETRTFVEEPGSRAEGPVFTVSGAAVAGTASAAASDGPIDPALAALPPGRRLEPASSDGGSALLVGLGVLGGTALLATVLLLRRRGQEDEP
jgi:hypothetical protein